MKKFFLLSSWLLLCLVLLSACSEPAELEVPVEPELLPIDDSALKSVDDQSYLSEVSFTPQEAQHFELVNEAVNLNQAELDKLAQNGFVVSDRLTWNRFIEAYAWIYWQDLPVLITTDSILHAVHQSYSDMLQSIENTILKPELESLLRATKAQVEADRQANADDGDRELAALYDEVALYLEVALALLNQNENQNQGESYSQAASPYVNLALSASGRSKLDLFGGEREIDFTLFKPRGHYATTPWLEDYFRAMTWLGQIDFRFVEVDALTNEAKLNLDAIAATAILHEAMERSEQRSKWAQVNGLLEVLVGRSDNMMLPDFERFLADAQLGSPSDVLAAEPAQILRKLSENDYGQQRITGQLISRHIDNQSPEPIERPVSFMLFGQRFVIDAYVMGNLVYDRLMVDGKPVERALPQALDVIYALGNDHAISHLSNELERYPYGGHLAALREKVDQLEPQFWDFAIYNQWLKLIRATNQPTIDETYPQAMRTAAWADKMLQTQLASWAQLRHDNLLYAKQSFTTSQVMCEYPAGYVEPYPEFYQALYDFAEAGKTALAQFDSSDFSSEYNIRSKEQASTYFDNVMAIAEQLKTLAEKELRLEEFTAEEEAFVKSIIVRQAKEVAGCGGPTFEDLWDGWYSNLFYDKDDNPAVIADIHTNPTNDPLSSLYPPRVLHVASGPVAPIFFIVDTDEGPTIYIGPAFTYFEIIEEGNETTSPTRLTDQEWRQRLDANAYPEVPEWTSSFRLPTEKKPRVLKWPKD